MEDAISGTYIRQRLDRCLQVTVLSSAERLDAFLRQFGGGDGKAKKGVRSGAAWGGCMLLFSDKKQTSPLYRSLAAQYAGKLAFGEVRYPVPAPCEFCPGVIALPAKRHVLQSEA